jgi:hypothetical protein
MVPRPTFRLEAIVDGEPKADCPGLLVVGDCGGKLGDRLVTNLKVRLKGAASRLLIEKSTGRLMQLAFGRRETKSSVGDALWT